MRDERFKFIFLMGIHIFILELLIMEHFINGTNLTEMSFKIPSGGILGYKKRVVRYKPIPPDPDMHNAMCGAKVINI